MIFYRTSDCVELSRLTKSMSFNRGSRQIYEGFAYFSEAQLNHEAEKDHYITIAEYTQGEIVGIAKLAKEDKYPGEVWKLAWIDVRHDFKNKGVSRGLIEEMATLLGGDLSLFCTRLRNIKQGESLEVVLKEAFPDGKIYSSEEDYIKKRQS